VDAGEYSAKDETRALFVWGRANIILLRDEKTSSEKDDDFFFSPRTTFARAGRAAREGGATVY